jgi:hypothetical protein
MTQATSAAGTAIAAQRMPVRTTLSPKPTAARALMMVVACPGAQSRLWCPGLPRRRRGVGGTGDPLRAGESPRRLGIGVRSGEVQQSRRCQLLRG